jgi:hypothetical protein
MSEKKGWGLTLVITGAMTGAIATAIIDYIKAKPIFSTVRSIFRWCWNFIISILNFDVKVWWLIAGVIIIFFIRYKLKKKFSINNYTNDFIDGWKWSWEWDYHEDVYDLKAYCPKPDCDTLMTNTSEQIYYCPRCKLLHNTPHQYDIKLIIKDELRKKCEAAKKK